MKDLGELRRKLAEHLREQGLEAVTAWGEGRRRAAGKAVAVVSLREIRGGAPGFQDYLGEEYDRVRGCWVERYGKKVELTFGLDVTAATAEETQTGVDRLGEILSQGGPENLKTVSFWAGETAYDSAAKRYVCPARAEFSAWAVAEVREGETFLDFEVKGESRR